MALGGFDASAGKYEAVDGGEFGVECVDHVFESCDIVVVYSGGGCVGGSLRVAGEVGSDVEETVLYELQHPAQPVVVGGVCRDDAYVAVEFVDGAVGFDAYVVFGDSLSAYE